MGEGVKENNMADLIEPASPGENGSEPKSNHPVFEKPRADKLRPELTRLPELTRGRILLRSFLHSLARAVILLLTRCQLYGLENFPRHGPALLVVNHLGDADAVIGLAFFPRQVEALAKIELYDFPVLGRIIEAYGVIWVHRGQPDRRAIQAALQGLREERLVGVAPEGRESVTGSLEEGTGGAAYIALKADVPIVPVTFLGTENNKIYTNLKRLRRSKVSMTVGTMFKLEQLPDRREAIRRGTRLIMERLALQLPKEYRGIYGV